jgi:hypothetical protein
MAIKKPQAPFRALRLAFCEQALLPGGRRTTPFNGKDESTHAKHGSDHLSVKHLGVSSSTPTKGKVRRVKVGATTDQREFCVRLCYNSTAAGRCQVQKGRIFDRNFGKRVNGFAPTWCHCRRWRSR